MAGIEPARAFARKILNLVCLPISPHLRGVKKYIGRVQVSFANLAKLYLSYSELPLLFSPIFGGTWIRTKNLACKQIKVEPFPPKK